MLNIFASVEKKIQHVCNGSGDVKEMRKILKRTGANINMIALDGGWTAMHAAAMQGFADLLNYLITEAGGNPSIIATADLLTPLHVGCWKGHIEVVKLLLKRGDIELDCQTKDGLTPLHFACWNGYFAICELLLQAGASVTIVNNVGQTPFMVAARFGRELILDLFLSTQPPQVQLVLLNSVDNNGCTALSHACYEGKDSCASLLLKRGADPSIVDSQGRGLLKYCRQNTSRILLKHMESVHKMEEDAKTPQGDHPTSPAATPANEEPVDDDKSESDDSNYRGNVMTQSFSYPRASPPVTHHMLPASHDVPSFNRSRTNSNSSHRASPTRDREQLLGGDYADAGINANRPISPSDSPLNHPDLELDDDIDDDFQNDGASGDDLEDDDALQHQSRVDHLWTLASGRVQAIDIVRDLWGLCGDETHPINNPLANTVTPNSFTEEERAIKLFMLLRKHVIPINKLRDRNGFPPLMVALLHDLILPAQVLLYYHADIYLTDGTNGNTLAHACASTGKVKGLELLHDYIQRDYTPRLDFLREYLHVDAGSTVRRTPSEQRLIDCLAGKASSARERSHNSSTHFHQMNGSSAPFSQYNSPPPGAGTLVPHLSSDDLAMHIPSYRFEIFDSMNLAHKTPLLVAAAANHLDVVRFLVEQVQVNVFAQDVHGYNVLHQCAQLGHHAILACILRLHFRQGPEQHLSGSRGSGARRGSHGRVPEDSFLVASNEDYQRWIQLHNDDHSSLPPMQIHYHTPSLLCELSRSGHLPADLTRDLLAKKYLCAVQSLALSEGAARTAASKRELIEKRRLVDALEAAMLGDASASSLSREQPSPTKPSEKSPGKIQRRDLGGKAKSSPLASSSSPSHVAPSKEVTEVFREKLRDQLDKFPSPLASSTSTYRSPAVARSRSSPQRALPTESPPLTRQYAFQRYYQKRYQMAETSAPSASLPQRSREGTGGGSSAGRQTASQPVKRAEPTPCLGMPGTGSTVVSALPYSPSRVFPFKSLRSTSDNGKQAGLDFGMQVFLGSLSRILDYRHNSVKRCFYRWKHRTHGRSTVSSLGQGLQSGTSSPGYAAASSTRRLLTPPATVPTSTSPAPSKDRSVHSSASLPASPPSAPPTSSPTRSPNPWVVRKSIHQLVETFEEQIQLHAQQQQALQPPPTPPTVPVFFSEAQKARLNSFYGTPAQNIPTTPIIREEDEEGDDESVVVALSDYGSQLISDLDEPPEDRLSLEQQWAQDLRAAVMTACWVAADGNETSGGTGELLPLVAQNVRTLWEIYLPFASQRSSSPPKGEPSLLSLSSNYSSSINSNVLVRITPSTRREGEERYVTEAVLLHYSDPMMTLDDLVHLLTSFDLFPRMCTRQRLMTIVEKLAPQVPIPTSHRTSPLRDQPIPSRPPHRHAKPGGQKDPSPPSECMNFLDFLKVLIALSQDLQVQGSGLRFTLLLHSMESSSGRERLTRNQREARIVPTLNMVRVPSAVLANNMSFTYRK